MSVSGVCLLTDDLGVFIPPFLLPLNPSGVCVLSFQEGDVPTDGGQSLGAGTCVQGKNYCDLIFWSPNLSLTAPLTSVSFSLNLHISVRFT